MTTTTVKIIGTGGDYSTLQSWEDAAPANLVSSDVVWQGKCKNETFSGSSGNLLTISGSTTDATRYKELTTDTGASFRDNANVQTNALRYNTANGAAIANSASYASTIYVNEPYFRISKLQIATTGTAGGCRAIISTIASTPYYLDIDGCILEGARAPVVHLYGSSQKIRNSAIIGRASSLASIAQIQNGSAAYNCTFAVPSDKTAATAAIVGLYTATTFTNCAFFGCTSVYTGGSAPTFTTCRTNVASPPSGCTTTTYNTSAFVNITDSTRDYRLPSGSALIDTGTTDSTNAATDIAGTARPSGSSYDVGAWEYAAGGGGYSLTVTAGGYTTSGNNVVLTAARVVQALAGSYAITGNNATLSSSVLLSALAGSYAYTGSDVGLTASRQLAVTAGSYAITGNVAGLNAARLLTATPGAYSISGNSVILTYNTVGSYALNVTAGSYSITGNDVALTAGRTLAVTPGAYAITGSDVVLTYGVMHTLNVTPGAYAITGYSAMLAKASTLQALAGAYAYTGRNVVLTYSGLADGVVDEVLLLSRITPEVQLLAELTQSVVLQSTVPVSIVLGSRIPD